MHYQEMQSAFGEPSTFPEVFIRLDRLVLWSQNEHDASVRNDTSRAKPLLLIFSVADIHGFTIFTPAWASACRADSNAGLPSTASIDSRAGLDMLETPAGGIRRRSGVPVGPARTGEPAPQRNRLQGFPHPLERRRPRHPILKEAKEEYAKLQ